MEPDVGVDHDDVPGVEGGLQLGGAGPGALRRGAQPPHLAHTAISRVLVNCSITFTPASCACQLARSTLSMWKWAPGPGVPAYYDLSKQAKHRMCRKSVQLSWRGVTDEYPGFLGRSGVWVEEGRPAVELVQRLHHGRVADRPPNIPVLLLAKL